MKRAFWIILITISTTQTNLGAENVSRNAHGTRGEIGTGAETGDPISGTLSGLVGDRELSLSYTFPIVVEAVVRGSMSSDRTTSETGQHDHLGHHFDGAAR